MSQALGPKARVHGWNFAFVRHPLERVYSALSMLAPGVPVLDAYWEHRDNYHLTPQAEILSDFRMDFVGTMDRLEEGWKVVMARLNVGPLDHLNRGEYEGTWRDHDWAFLHNRYSQDLTLGRDWTF